MANYGVDSLRWSYGVIKRSLYKPFGTYMFFSGHGTTSIGIHDVVLKTLHWTMQSHENISNNIAHDCVLEHLGYDSILKQVIENSISGRRFENPDSKFSYHMGISLKLEVIGVGAQVLFNSILE